MDNLIGNNNVSHFFRELIMSPNIMFSIIKDDSHGNQHNALKPLLYSLGNNIKLYQLFYQCIHNFALKLLRCN